LTRKYFRFSSNGGSTGLIFQKYYYLAIKGYGFTASQDKKIGIFRPFSAYNTGVGLKSENRQKTF